jgi:hypothetical protein
VKYNEIQGNLFSLDKTKYHFVQCISKDVSMSMGVAVDFADEFKLRKPLESMKNIKVEDIILVNGVFNLITKTNYWDKPTYGTLRRCIFKLAQECKKLDIKYLAMPRISCNLDKLSWNVIRKYIKQEFNDLDINIEVRYA